MPDRHGPLRQKNFEVQIDGVTVPGFTKIELPDVKTEVTEYREGNNPNFKRKLWGKRQYGELILERGASAENSVLDDWVTKSKEGNLDEARKTVVVKIFNENGKTPIVQWEHQECWVAEYKPPTLNAHAGKGKESIAIERFVVTFDEVNRRNV